MADDHVADLEQWAHDLPYPLAAVLWSVAGDDDERGRFEASIHFFEVAARFLTIVLLSGLHSDRATYIANRGSWQGRGATPGALMRRSTLGSWTRLGGDVSKVVRRLNQADPAAVASLYGMSSTASVVAITSRPVVDTLRAATERRNEWRGHDAAAAPSERRRRSEEMTRLIRDLRLAINGALDGWRLWQPVASRSTGGHNEVDALLLLGPNPRPRSRTFTIDTQPRTDRLYLSTGSSTGALELVPLIRAERPAEATDVAVYFLDRVERNAMRWLSYDTPQRPEISTSVEPEVVAVIDDLDAPVDPAQPGQEPTDERVDTPGTAPTLPSTATAEAAAEMVVGGLRSLLVDLSAEGSSRKVTLTTVATLGSIQVRADVCYAVANLPIEFAINAAGALITEVPVTADGLPGVEVIVDAAEPMRSAIANFVVADGLARGLDATDSTITDRVAMLIGGDPVVGRGAVSRVGLDRASTEDLWDRLTSVCRDIPTFEAASIARWPGQLRLEIRAGVTLAIVPQGSTTLVLVILGPTIDLRVRERLVRRRHRLTSTGDRPSLQRLTSDLVAIYRIDERLTNASPARTLEAVARLALGAWLEIDSLLQEQEPPR